MAGVCSKVGIQSDEATTAPVRDAQSLLSSPVNVPEKRREGRQPE